MALGPRAWQKVRQRISHLLRHDNPALQSNQEMRLNALEKQSQVEMLLPVAIRDYTDFYSSIEHATNVGTMFRGKDNALMPNWRHLPVAYHGRASSIVISGTPIRRPLGQTKPDDASAPVFGPSRQLDFELELAFFVGIGNEMGTRVSTAEASDRIFGFTLFNDWSARDIQKWEYVPLGPFLGKNFGSTISPWIVTIDALDPFRRPGPIQEPEVLPYLQCEGNWAYDLNLEVLLKTEKMAEPQRISHANFQNMYWNPLQQFAHHTVNGCNLATGDCLASGTVSGSAPDSYGSLLELTWKGEKPLNLPDGEQRKFLEDGDEVTLRGWCQGVGYRVGFGECQGKILPATM
jgi:fumarylacetoacetase